MLLLWGRREEPTVDVRRFFHRLIPIQLWWRNTQMPPSSSCILVPAAAAAAAAAADDDEISI